MNIVDPKVELCTAKGIHKIELIGKVCTKLEHTIKEGTAIKFCTDRLKEGHTAIFEHEYIYFNLSNVSDTLVDEFCKLNQYIRRSYDGKYIGFCYRVFIDIMSNSRRNKAIWNRINHQSEVSDLFYVMLYKTPEFYYLLCDEDYILSKVDTTNFKYLDDMCVVRTSAFEILSNAPEIYNITFKITTDRGVTHELVRHKEMSFMQESTRYCNYTNGRFGNSISFIIPNFNDLNISDADCQALTEIVSDSLNSIEADYQEITKEYGIQPQYSRCILPNAIKSDIYMSGTLDMWIGEKLTTEFPKLTIDENKGFLPLRDHPRAHPQMIMIAKMIGNILNYTYPNQINQIKTYFK